MKKVILVSGKLQSGKNTFAEMINEILTKKGKKVTEDLFAHDLKEGVQKDFKMLQEVINKEVDSIINHAKRRQLA